MHAARILFATDLSGAARQCHAIVAKLAATLRAPLLVLHVDDAPERLDPVADLREYHDMVSMFRRLRIEQLQEDFAALGVEISFRMDRGKPERVVTNTARDNDVGLVVVGQHSRTGPFKKLLGSTASRVLHLSDVPVLVVPIDDTIDDAAPLTESPDLVTIIVPTDLSETSGRALRATLDLARPLGARVHVTHALELPTYMPTSSGEGFVALPGEPLGQLERHYGDRLAIHVTAEADDDTSLTSAIAFGDSTVAGILAETARVDADLIAVSSTGKGAVARFFLGSVTEALAKRSPVPVLVYPPEYLAAWER